MMSAEQPSPVENMVQGEGSSVAVVESPNHSSSTQAGNSSTAMEEGSPSKATGLLDISQKSAKKKKRKKAGRDHGGPRQPLNGYVRFMNDRREKVRTDFPSLSFSEMTKIMAAEWSKLPQPDKQKYLDAAEQDKERYQKELSEYKQTDAYKEFERKQQQLQQQLQQQEQEKKKTDDKVPEDYVEKNGEIAETVNIFTEEFMDHNKVMEAELRQLRKSNVECEEQNAVLQKHIENMKEAVEKLEEETSRQRRNNVSLQRHLNDLRSSFAEGFASLPLPGLEELPTPNNMDEYVDQLHFVLEHPRENVKLISSIREVICKLEFPS